MTNVISSCASYFIFCGEEQAAKFCKLAGAVYFAGPTITAYIPDEGKCEVSWLMLNEHLRK